MIFIFSCNVILLKASSTLSSSDALSSRYKGVPDNAVIHVAIIILRETNNLFIISGRFIFKINKNISFLQGYNPKGLAHLQIAMFLLKKGLSPQRNSPSFILWFIF